MARTPGNTDLPLGSICPAFELRDVLSGRAVGRDDIFAGPGESGTRRGLLVAFVCVHCPFVMHMEQAFTALLARHAQSIAAVAVMSNDVASHPEDSPDCMRAQANRLGWARLGIPYLLDESQETAREFHAACTPDLYLFNDEYKLTYHGQFDRTRPYRQSDSDNGVSRDPHIHTAAHGTDLSAAVDALLAGEAPVSHQVPGLGCNIKWR